ncbi:ABC transporter ATP-binding protein [Paradevosia shaoguanensis]|uniref:ABC transporter ATP-binding protein/permease n=1 Tax=Paradevosia shaoguanensis TaxID=1335043 RepID=A0AA41QLY4_9HYPH|nr:ABC transporter ATP-binding protein [Paradevosia shaoguanensis]MCF1741781.1 ABC transporter ATP-binding protein/permease [Paradevosia shaoguanensis]MCI0126264.1 ABC transporter ATP-binding protein/permease [Paradevosia shaoguanensis]
MKIIDQLNRTFENWVDPFARKGDLQPPAPVLQFFWYYIRQAKLPFFALLVLGGLVALVEAALFYYVGRLVDILDSSTQAQGWQGLLGGFGNELLFMLFVVVIARFIITWLSAVVEEQTINIGFYNLVRWQAYAHVIRQSLNFFQSDFSGAIASKVWQSGGAVGDFMVSLLQVVWFIAVYALTTIILVGQLDWRLAAAVILWIVVFGFMARYYVPRMRKRSAASAEAASALTGRIVDSFGNIQTLKLFGTSKGDDEFVHAGFDNYIAAVRRLARMLVSVRSAMAMLSGIMIAGIAALSVHLWTQGIVTVGGVAFTMGLILRLYNLLGRMMTQLNGLMRNYGTAQNSAELIARPLELQDAPDARPLVVTKAAIDFKDVSFHYGRESGVIDHLSLSIKPGERIGLIGRSGAGKSTLVNLLLRFYDLQGGRIFIDGQDISKVTQESLRANIGVVTQDTSLLHRSVRANLIYGRPEATGDEMMAAAALAEADDFIEALIDQKGRTAYDAYVGERGVKLSGGQRQRIAIARVLIKNAPILVLDEATSALDSEVEAAIQQQLDSLMENKTVIAIAHRLSTIAAMDRLVVLDKGKIVEEGTHAQLLELGGHYAHLWERQSGGFLDTSEAAQ